MKNVIKIKIYGTDFSVRFLPENLMEKYNRGTTWYDKRAIDILETLDEKSTELTIKHELTHAFLLMQGRRYQKKFDLEDVCEFVSYTCEEITKLTNYIMKKRNE